MVSDTRSLAVWRSDRTAALFDGRVRVRGFSIALVDAPLEEIFARAFDRGEFDISELSFSNFLRSTVAGTCQYVGIPVFPSRSFRHGTFYVRSDGSVRAPGDLVGRRVGVREYSMTAALAARGALRDQYDVDTSRIRWVMGDVDEHEREVIRLPILHRPVDIEIAPSGRLLSEMLLSGELDAVLAYKPISPFLAPGGRVRRLIEDYAEAERIYFRRFRIFPIMHVMGLRRDHAAERPELGVAVFESLVEAHRLAMQDLRAEQALKVSLPWLGEEVGRTVALMGEDFWPNGLAANRGVLAKMVEWSLADGLIPRAPTSEELFLPALRAT
jgi:4,5-dihydroxyphthalate decarboxylase